MNNIRDYCVLVVDDHHMLRLGLRTFIQTQGTIVSTWLEASSLADAFEIFHAHPEIDVVLLDLNLPDSQGLQSVQRFFVEFPKVRLVVYSATHDEFVKLQALAMGVIGFIPKSASAESMLSQLESLLVGAGKSINRDQPSGSVGQVHPLLEKLQLQEDRLNATKLKVLELVLAGMSNQEIAVECNLALGTVKNAVSSIMLVLNVNSRSHLISLFR